MDKRTALVWLLRVFGAMAVLALPVVFAPTSWIAGVHDWLGLGGFPEEPIAQYLARSLSLFYAGIGGLLLVLASDVERYRTLIRYVGWGSAAIGVGLLGIDLHAGLPSWWALHEGPSATLWGLALVWLVRSIPAR